MRLKTLCLSLLLLVGINLSAQLILLQPPSASAAIIGLGAYPSEDEVQLQRKFTYEAITVSGKSVLSIYTVQCNDPDNCATVEQRGIAERWVHDPNLGGTDNELVFTPTNEAGTAEDLHSPKLVVSKTNLSTGTVSGTQPNEYWSFGIQNGTVAKSLVGGTVGELGVGGGTDDSGIPGTGPDEGEDTAEDTSCESEGGLGWIICPVIYLLDNATGWLDDRIEDLLTIRSDSYKNSELKIVWARMRNIAYSILVPIILIMVITTALGFELVSAYSVKKALPRFVMAIIFIALSWEISTFLITMSNDVGQGILGLMTQPFDAINIREIIGAAAGVSATAIAPATIGWAILAGKLSLGILFMYAGSALMFMLVVFFVLTLRQVFILVAMLFAPLAILAWIFPGNDKLWKLWWQTFSKLLLMFPLIMAIIAGGRIFAAVVNIGNDADIMNTLLKITAYLIPYAFIPFTFKFAGGLFATISGMVNDRGKGVFDKLSQAREKQREELGTRAGMNKRFNEKYKRLNKLGGWSADPMNSYRIGVGTSKGFLGKLPGGERGRALAAELTQKGAQQSQDLAKWLSQAGFNQEALTAIMQNVQKNGGRFSEETMLEQVKKMKTGSAQDQAGAQQLEHYGAFLADTWRNEDFMRANVGMAAGLAKASQGFLTPADESKYSNFLNGVAPGLGESFKTQAGLLNKEGFSKVGYSTQIINGQYVEGGTAARGTQLMRTGVQDFAKGKPSQFKELFGGDDGVLQKILTAPPVETYVDENGETQQRPQYVDASGEKLVVTKEKKEALVRNLMSAAYGYDTPAETTATLLAEVNRIGAASGDQELQKFIAEEEVRARRPGTPDAAKAGTAAPPPEDGQ